MRRRALLAALVAALPLAGCETAPEPEVEGAPMEAARVLRTYPHDPQAFTQGLVLYGDTLIESTGGRGASTLRKVLLASGAVVQRVSLEPRYFGEGAAILGGSVYQLTWEENTGFVYDLATLRVTGTFRYDGEGWGLTSDGRSLVMSDGTDELRYLDPATFAVTRTLSVTDAGQPVHFLNELEWVRGEIWANIWHEDRIARIDPTTGVVRAWLDLADLAPPIRDQNDEAVPNGIAYDQAAGRLLVTGKLWPTLYEIGMPAGR